MYSKLCLSILIRVFVMCISCNCYIASFVVTPSADCGWETIALRRTTNSHGCRPRLECCVWHSYSEWSLIIFGMQIATLKLNQPTFVGTWKSASYVTILCIAYRHHYGTFSALAVMFDVTLYKGTFNWLQNLDFFNVTFVSFLSVCKSFCLT